MSGTNSNAATFAARHAPKSFGDLVFKNANVQQRLTLYATHNLHDSLVLYGPYGTAKSTAALTIIAERRALAGCIGRYLHHYQGGQLGNSLTSVLNSISMMLALEPDPCPYVLIDEADQLGKQAQLELRHMLSTMPYLRVIMTTNHISKVDGGVQSRCDCIELLPPDSADWAPRAQAILANEGVVLPLPNVQSLIAGMTDVRRILRTLEMLVVKHGMQGAQALNATAAAPPINPATLTLVPGNVLVQTGSNIGAPPPNISVFPGGASTSQPTSPQTPS